VRLGPKDVTDFQAIPSSDGEGVEEGQECSCLGCRSTEAPSQCGENEETSMRKVVIVAFGQAIILAVAAIVFLGIGSGYVAT
jgi:hypothetical protein